MRYSSNVTLLYLYQFKLLTLTAACQKIRKNGSFLGRINHTPPLTLININIK